MIDKKVDKKEFNNMKLELQAYDKKREELIKQSRVVLKQAKLLIYSIHRNDSKQVSAFLTKLRKDKSSMDRIIKANPQLVREGSYSAACQEYVEAVALLEFEKCVVLSSAKKLNVSTSDYLMGLADLTGELGRLAVACAIKGNYEKVEYIRQNVEELWGEMLKFDFRNSALRRKFDSIKYNLRKIEDINYDIKVKK